MEQPKLTHRFCFTDLADFTTVSVWLGSCLFVVAMSKTQNEDGRYWAKGGWEHGGHPRLAPHAAFAKTPPHWAA
jgi:hypothetical protein